MMGLSRPTPASAQGQSTWTGTTGNWHTASNWQFFINGGPPPTAQVPTALDTVAIGLSTIPRVVTIDSANAFSGMTSIGKSAGYIGSVTLTNGRTWTVSGDLSVGSAGTGSITVQGGSTLNSSTTSMGNQLSGSGAVTVSGSGSVWNNTGALTISTKAKGTVIIEAGGKLVSGATSIGQLTSNAGGGGSVTVRGANSLWETTSEIMVGEGGNGSLTVEAGGTVKAAYIRSAVSSTGTGTISLKGTEAGGRGVLETSYIKEWPGSGGSTIQFDGGVLRATANQASFLQTYEAGDLQIADGGLYFDTQGFTVGVGSTLQGTGGLTKLGSGRLTIAGAHTYAGNTVVQEGTLELSGATLSGGLVVSSGATATGSGTVGGNSVVSGALTVGTASSTPATISFTDDLTLDSSAVVNLDIKSTSLFDTVSAGDWLTFGGVLNVTLDPNFAFQSGNSFDLFQFVEAAPGSSFSAINLINSSYFASLDYSTGVLTLSSVPEPSAAGLLLLGVLGIVMCRRRRRD
ncbi:MAG TPA: autotransporter-associated beta strand repeat-containing protein [Verrucomicrobium sp.]|nr:autotransporter-associated beta strand repeat-containing protein [Verrucomicrobium sp.]